MRFHLICWFCPPWKMYMLYMLGIFRVTFYRGGPERVLYFDLPVIGCRRELSWGGRAPKKGSVSIVWNPVANSFFTPLSRFRVRSRRGFVQANIVSRKTLFAGTKFCPSKSDSIRSTEAIYVSLSRGCPNAFDQFHLW